MARNIKVKWGPARKLVKCPITSGQLMKLRGEGALKRITNGPGVYFFARRHGRTDKDKLIPLYVGRADNVRRRVFQHLESMRLMSKIRTAASGEKVLVVGTVERDAKRAVVIVEKALIKKAEADGYKLFNKQHIKTRVDTIHLTGNRATKNTFGNEILFPVAMRRKRKK